MASADEIQACVNQITVSLNVLGDVDWNAYTVEGPGMNEACNIARSLIVQTQMMTTVASAIIEPVQVFAAAIENGDNDG